MTEAALRGGRFIAGTTSHARTAGAAEAMAGAGPSLMYFYVNELDKAGHRHGCQSPQWEHQLEELDATVRRLSATLPPGTTVLLTADHGMVDVPESQRIDYSAEPGAPRRSAAHGRRAADGPSLSGGSNGRRRPRPPAGKLADPLWRENLGLHREEAIAGGLFGDVRPEVAFRIGDVMIAARDALALYDTRRVRPTALEVVGQHGSLTKAEREVPLLYFQADGKRTSRLAASSGVGCLGHRT